MVQNMMEKQLRPGKIYEKILADNHLRRIKLPKFRLSAEKFCPPKILCPIIFQESFEDDSFAVRRKSVDVHLHRRLEKEAKQREVEKAERAQTMPNTSTANTDTDTSNTYDQVKGRP